MTKRLQNRVAESRWTLPVMAVLACGVWVLAGLISQQLWLQLVCFVLSTMLMVELNNGNALIRIYSRMVSCSFLALSCCACYLYPSMGAQLVTLCLIVMYVISFHCYQDKHSPGWTFYAFLCVGMASMVFVQLFYYIPLLWLLMRLQLNAMSWRNFFASIIGLLTPYWLAFCYFLFIQDLTVPLEHIAKLAIVDLTPDYTGMPVVRVALYAFVVVLAITGTIHFWRNSPDDKIRIRQFFGYFMAIDAFTLVFLALQPQHFTVLMPMAIVTTAPLIGHFIALTKTRITNIAAITIAVICLLLTAAALWMPSYTF